MVCRNSPILKLTLLVASLLLTVQPASATCLRGELEKLERQLYATQGYFKTATEDLHRALQKAFLESGISKTIRAKIKRFKAEDLAVDLNNLDNAARTALLENGQKNLSSLYYFTSGAGLWNRGGNQVKALVPFNLKSLLTEAEFAEVLECSAVLKQKPEEILKRFGIEATSAKQAESIAIRIISDKNARLGQLISKARNQPGAITPLDMKLVTAATQSRKAGTYVVFDVWTSEQTHAPIQEYLRDFENNYQNKIFDPDPIKNAKIKEALKWYIQESRARGETHLFGYQLGYRALDPKTGLPIEATQPIGEGHGMAKAYLDESGRTAKLREMGKTVMLFDNIEENSDLSLLLGAHLKSGKDASFVLVPEKPGYKGGNPFLVERDGAWRFELHEMFTVPEEFKTGNDFFNSNTNLQSLSLKPPKALSFEPPTLSKMIEFVRAKISQGDISRETPTAAIGGRIGIEYENFKSYEEFGQNGEKLIESYRKIWERDYQ